MPYSSEMTTVSDRDNEFIQGVFMRLQVEGNTKRRMDSRQVWTSQRIISIHPVFLGLMVCPYFRYPYPSFYIQWGGVTRKILSQLLYDSDPNSISNLPNLQMLCISFYT
jgi:hypothetical protein